MARPFDELPVTAWRRELFGAGEPRNSCLPISAYAVSDMLNDAVRMNGTNWVNATWMFIDYPLMVHDFDKKVYQYYGHRHHGPWYGVAMFRMLINGIKVYPFADEEELVDGVVMHLGSLSMIVRRGDKFSVEVRSSDARDIYQAPYWPWVGFRVHYTVCE